jgi:hypothetical protein
MGGGNSQCMSTKYQSSDTVSYEIIYTDVTILFLVSMEETRIKIIKTSRLLYWNTLII